MTSVDTNILFSAIVSTHPAHDKAAEFVKAISARLDVAISEFVLVELYNLLRNPVISSHPLTPSAAVDVCESFRQHPHWQVLGFPPESRAFHDLFWPILRSTNFARRRAFDWRLDLRLTQQGVTDFATANVKDFDGFGFASVRNPLLG